MISKTCSICKIEKNISEFSKKSRNADGLNSQCRSCIRKYVKEYRNRLGSRAPEEVYGNEQTTKICGTCKEKKLIDDFRKRLTTKDGREHSCKPCRRKLTDAYSRLYPDKRRLVDTKGSIKKLYGLSWEEYNSLLTKQDNRCAICGLYVESRTKIRPCIDHDHVTGRIRGILCNNCNFLLGNAKDNMQILQNAMDYLMRWNNRQ